MRQWFWLVRFLLLQVQITNNEILLAFLWIEFFLMESTWLQFSMKEILISILHI